jgi:hypothetical protein
VEHRRNQRYELNLPLEILQVGEKRMNRMATTHDISSSGVSFVSDDHLEIGGRIEYMVAISKGSPPVRIRCLGRVLRSRPVVSETSFEVAVTMERYEFVRPEKIHAVVAGA